MNGPGSLGRAVALARHLARQSGGRRTALAAACCALGVGWYAAGWPVVDPADRALLVAGAALAAAAAAAGLGAGLGAAGTLTRSPELAVLAATPMGRGTLALGALGAAAWHALAAGALGAVAGLVPVLVWGGADRAVERWADAARLDGVQRPRGNSAVRWTAANAPPLVAQFVGLHPDRLGEGPLPLRLRLRLALAAGPAHDEGLAAAPVAVAAGPPGAATALPTPLGNPWGPEGLQAQVPRDRIGADGRLEVRVATATAGLTLGAGPADLRVGLRPTRLGAAYARAAVGLLPTLATIALLAATLSVICSRGVALLGGVAAAIGLGLAPLAREALADLPAPHGLGAALAGASGWLLAALPRPSGSVGACFGGQDVPWTAVAQSGASHVPALVACAGLAWWLVRRRDW